MIGTTVTLKAGFGFWNTTRYPIGGSFSRAPEGGLRITITRTFARCQSSHGTNAAGTFEGGKAAFDLAHCEGGAA